MITRQAKAEQGSRLLLQADIEYCIKQLKELPRQLKSAKDMSELLVKAAKVGKRGVATLGYANELTQSLYEILFKYCLDKTYNGFFQDNPWLPSQILRGHALSFIVGSKFNDSLGSSELLVSDSNQYFYDQRYIKAVRMLGLYLKGISAMHQGKFIDAESRFREANSYYEMLRASRDKGAIVLAELRAKCGMDIPTATLTYGSLCLHFLGKLAEAITWSEGAHNRAMQLSHDFTMAFCLTFRAMFYKLRGADWLASNFATAAKEVSTQHSFAFYIAYATFLQGASQTPERLGKAIEQMRIGINLAKWTGSSIFRHFFDAHLVEAFQASETPATALEWVNDAINISRFIYPEEQLYIGELYRIKGNIIWHSWPEKAEEAEWYLGESFLTAYKQQALSQQLHTARDLSELWLQQGKRAKARDFLGSFVSLFPGDGCDDLNLKEAKILLERLS